MLDKSGLDLRCGKSVPGHVNNIVDTAPDPVVAFMISASAIAGELQHVNRMKKSNNRLTYVIALVYVEIGVHIALMSTPDSSSHARPGLLNSQNTFYVIAMYFYPGHRVNNGRLDTKER